MGVWLAIAVAGGVAAAAIVWLVLRPRPRAGADAGAAPVPAPVPGGGAPATVGAAAPAAALPAGTELDQDVEFTVYRPRRLAPQEWHTLLAFAHRTELVVASDGRTIDPIEEVARQATAVLAADEASYAPVAESSSRPLPRGGDVTFVPVLPGCDVNPPHRTFTWNEPVHREEFRVRPTSVPPGETVRGHLAVYLGAVLLAEVNLSMRVESTGVAAPRRAETEPATARRFERIFLSYSHEDSNVVDLVESLNIMDVEYVRDSHSLRSGQDWREGLQSLIRSADRFQLFWSRNSMASSEVANEWRYALSLGRPDFIRPVYWETPRPEDPARELPPQALNRLHFQRLDFGDDLDRAVVTPLRPPTAAPASPAPAPAPAPPSEAPGAPARRGVSKVLVAAVGAAAAALALVVATGGPQLGNTADDDIAGPDTGGTGASVPATGDPDPGDGGDGGGGGGGGGGDTVAALVTSCTGADLDACDRLFAATDDGELVALAASCGGASSVAFAGDCARHFDPALEEPAAACAAGDMGACDDLAGDSPARSPYRVLAGSCGGRRQVGESTGTCLTPAAPP
jgi:TIR domain